LLNTNLTRKVLGPDNTGKYPTLNIGYAPTEQYKGHYTALTDVFALGAIMHQLLTGKKPIPFKFSPLREANSDISIAVDNIIMTALENDIEYRHQTAEAMLQAFAEIYNTPHDMVIVPAGFFWMGSNTGEENEKPVHKVFVSSFYIDRYPVTNIQYAKFVEESGYKGQGEWKKYYNEKNPDHPVVAVNWFEAKAYSEWYGKRLATEAEWEKAARGNDMRKYPWGNKWEKNLCNTPELDDPAIIKKRASIYDGRGTTPSGSFPEGQSPYGVMDMAGQVWEWCADWYDEHYYSKTGKICRDPKGSEVSEYRVLRGGSWGNLMGPCRCTCRSYSQKPDYISFNVGFRCVKDT
jgi:iron(II)-dependent oxidoreductase